MSEIGLRLSGPNASIDAMLADLRGLPQTEQVEELGVNIENESDDSSSAGLPDDTHAASRVVTLHTIDDTAAPGLLRGRMETVARDTGVVVEWLEPF